jgi:DNA processing protein
MALEQDRQVFAVPGSPLTGKTRGSNRLLKEGARLVECVEDVIEELVPQLSTKVPQPLVEGGANLLAAPKSSGEHILQAAQSSSIRIQKQPGESPAPEPADVTTILQCLKGADKLHVDAIIGASGLAVAAVLKLLLELELRGMVTQHPGKLFSLNAV